MPRDEDRIEQGTGDPIIDTMGDEGLAYLADRVESSLGCVERSRHLHALEAPAMRMVVVTLRRIAQRDALAFLAVG